MGARLREGTASNGRLSEDTVYLMPATHVARLVYYSREVERIFYKAESMIE